MKSNQLEKMAERLFFNEMGFCKLIAVFFRADLGQNSG